MKSQALANTYFKHLRTYDVASYDRALKKTDPEVIASTCFSIVATFFISVQGDRTRL
jgi:hypothetical protein